MNAWVGSVGIDGPCQMPVVMIHAWTWMPWAWAASMSDCSGSNGAGETPGTAVRGRLERLQKQYPGRFAAAQLRTLQRRIREWRGAMARTLVHACLDGKQATGNPVVVGTQTKG